MLLLKIMLLELSKPELSGLMARLLFAWKGSKELSSLSISTTGGQPTGAITEAAS
jgi:hypothetical protein